jgi:hypothetical protein
MGFQAGYMGWQFSIDRNDIFTAIGAPCGLDGGFGPS